MENDDDADYVMNDKHKDAFKDLESVASQGSTTKSSVKSSRGSETQAASGVQQNWIIII